MGRPLACAALAGVLAGVLTLAAGAALAQGDPDRGAAVFARCATCHILTGKGFKGPPLAGVFERKAGTASGFAYSAAMTKSGIVWDDDSLNDFLADPAKMVPGTSMIGVALPDPQERADVIAYLRAHSPPP